MRAQIQAASCDERHCSRQEGKISLKSPGQERSRAGLRLKKTLPEASGPVFAPKSAPA